MPKLLLFVAIVLALVGTAWAAAGGSAGEEDGYQRAARLVRQAKERRATADPRGALDLYRQAHDAFPSPLLFWPMAELSLETGQAREGLQALRQHRDGISSKDYPSGQGEVEIKALEQKLLAQLGRQVVVPRPNADRLSQPMGRRSFWQKHQLSLGVAGVAVALAVAGVGVGIATYRGYADLTPTCAGGPSGCPPDAVASLQDRALATNVLFGLAGGAALVAGGVFLFGEHGAVPMAIMGSAQMGAGLLVRY